MPGGRDRRLLSASTQEPTSASSASRNPAFDQASISKGMPFRSEICPANINRSGPGGLLVVPWRPEFNVDTIRCQRNVLVRIEFANSGFCITARHKRKVRQRHFLAFLLQSPIIEWWETSYAEVQSGYFRSNSDWVFSRAA